MHVHRTLLMKPVQGDIGESGRSGTGWKEVRMTID
jgi:hypothetical protein